MENKQKICTLLLATLQATHNQEDLTDIRYDKTGSDELVTLTWKNGYQKRVNVSMDSGTAMIRDIMKSID